MPAEVPFKIDSEVNALALQNDFSACRAMIARHSHTFYKAFSRLPAEKANAVYAVYAFCRTSDDLIDVDGSLDGLQRHAEDLEKFLAGKTPDTFMWRALRHVFERYSMNHDAFRDMIRGQQIDYTLRRVQTLDELQRYCYFVAGTVGLMLLPVLASDHHAALHKPVLALGEAMQITNILRDVGEDWRRDRIYLPADLLRYYGYRDSDLAAGAITPAFRDVWEHLAGLAEVRYREFEKSLPLFDADSRKAVAASALFYRQILSVVRRNHYDCLHQRCVVSPLEKTALSLKLVFA